MSPRFRRVGSRVGVGLIALLVAIGATVSAQSQNGQPAPFRGRGPGGPPPGGPGGPGGVLGPLGMFIPRLGLSDAQKDQIKAIVQAHEGSLKPLGDRARLAHQALEDAVMSGAPDESLIRQRSAEVAAAQADIDVVRARIFAEVFQILTPDQQAQLRDAQAKMKDRANAARGGGRRGNQSKSGA